jgi:hypothetical protein
MVAAGAERPEGEIGAPGVAVRAFVIEDREDLEIAREVRELLSEGTRPR